MAYHAGIFALWLVTLAVVISNANAKTIIKNGPACDIVCTANYAPVCGSADGAKQITFGNGCVMDRASCEQRKTYREVHKGECKNSSGVRLS